MRANDFTTESAVEELKNKLPSLKNTSYDTIDELMQKISRRYKLTGKKLHDLFVHKYGHTPDTWIKKIKNRLSEYGDEIVAEGTIQKDYPQYGGKDPNKTMTYDRLVGPGYAGEPWSDSTDNWSGEEGPKLPPNTKPTIRLSDKSGNEADFAVDSPQAKQVYADRMQKYGADVNGPVMKALTTAFSKPVDRSKVKTIGQSDSTSDFTDSGLDNEIIPSKVIKPTTSSNTDTDNVDNDDKPMRYDVQKMRFVPVDDPAKSTLKPADALGPGEEEIPPSAKSNANSNWVVFDPNTGKPAVNKSSSNQKQPVKPITPSSSSASSTTKPPKSGSWQELAQLNKITDPTKLQAGTKIKTPSGDEIPVAKGDTLASIAKSLATTGQPPSQLNPKPITQQAGAGRGQQGGATADEITKTAQAPKPAAAPAPATKPAAAPAPATKPVSQMTTWEKLTTPPTPEEEKARELAGKQDMEKVGKAWDDFKGWVRKPRSLTIVPGKWETGSDAKPATDPAHEIGQQYGYKPDELIKKLTPVKENSTHHLVKEFEMFLESKLLNDDWQKVNKRDKTDGMSRKAVKAYRRENPGSKLKTAVTTKPSKLKKGSKSAKRRKSFCARMSGMKKAHASAKTKRDPNSPINKALRRWNCESIEEMQNLMMIAEQKVAEAKNLKQQAAIAIAKQEKQKKKGVTESSEQAAQALQRGLQAAQQKTPGIDHVFATGVIKQIQPDGTIVVAGDNSTNKIKQLLALGGGSQFKVVNDTELEIAKQKPIARDGDIKEVTNQYAIKQYKDIANYKPNTSTSYPAKPRDEEFIKITTNLPKESIEESVDTPDEVQQIKDFIKWSMKILNVKTKPKFTLSKNTEEAQAGHHTGVHSGDRIWIYIGNRNLIDIFRTIFHELVHQRQEELNMIKDGDSYPGSPIEAMADMMAGKYIKIYGKEHPEIFQ